MANAWLVLAAGDDRQHGGNDGYDDRPELAYSWDDTVANHGAIRVGDAIILWDKKVLLGASVIERIDEGSSIKPVYRCSHCGGSHIKRRKTLQPPWRCFRCSSNFEEPLVEHKHVHTYVSRHDVGWVDLEGVLSGPELRALCESPKSQLSLRTLRWADFRSAVAGAANGIPLTVIESWAARIRGGHSSAVVRVRRGQAAFRTRLLAEQGCICAMTGPAPASALEAGHLYSYAKVGEHHGHGGLLLRRDVHRMFDLGQIAVEPRSLTIDLDPEIEAYPVYAPLQGRSLQATVTGSQRTWFAQHWAEHRAVG